ncbi:MAG: ISL3 family transposase [Bdellovibrionaceae bacterium]|nr:ISL3 family transposase [Pseudobdellovibrionaceae bacterium]
MTPEEYVAKNILLPELKLEKVIKRSAKRFDYHLHKTNSFEVCPKCATKSSSVHDYRTICTRHAKYNAKHIHLVIKKRRFRCPNCKKVFTEPVAGIRKGFRTSEKYRSGVLYDCQRFTNLKDVAKSNRCSQSLVGKVFYERLEIELRETNNTPWSKSVGIDEHSFKRAKKKSRKSFVTCFVDLKLKRLRELAPSRNAVDLQKSIAHIPGRENVTNVVIDLTDGYKNFAQNYFFNANIVADKFHVLRLINPALNKHRKEVVGDRKNPIRFLLLKNRSKLKPEEVKAVNRFCRENATVREIYQLKQRINGFYRIKGFKQASRVLTKITDDIATSEIKEIKTLRKTLMKWRKEILQYFKTGLTNARTEGFNRKAKLIQRMACGYRSHRNYRLRALYACR